MCDDATDGDASANLQHQTLTHGRIPSAVSPLLSVSRGCVERDAESGSYRVSDRLQHAGNTITHQDICIQPLQWRPKPGIDVCQFINSLAGSLSRPSPLKVQSSSNPNTSSEVLSRSARASPSQFL